MRDHAVHRSALVPLIIRHFEGTGFKGDGFFKTPDDRHAPLLPVANAIRDAVGVRITERPVTPQRTPRALDEKRRRVS